MSFPGRRLRTVLVLDALQLAVCYAGGMTQTSDRPVGRPSKLTQEFIAAAYQVVNQEDNALIFTDEELLFAINEKLSKEAQISKRTFEAWKSGDVSDDVEGQEFLRLIQLALQKQKKDIFFKLKTDEKGWQRFAWIAERKWNEWNLKKNIGISKTEDGAASLAAALLGSEEEVVPAETSIDEPAKA